LETAESKVGDVNGAANIGRKVTAISSLAIEQVKGIMAYPVRL
jgi:hypothetical protein